MPLQCPFLIQAGNKCFEFIEVNFFVTILIIQRHDFFRESFSKIRAINRMRLEDFDEFASVNHAVMVQVVLGEPFLEDLVVKWRFFGAASGNWLSTVQLDTLSSANDGGANDSLQKRHIDFTGKVRTMRSLARREEL